MSRNECNVVNQQIARDAVQFATELEAIEQPPASSRGIRGLVEWNSNGRARRKNDEIERHALIAPPPTSVGGSLSSPRGHRESSLRLEGEGFNHPRSGH
jgi:hypothetical protein